jgi:hypothetical protein
MAKISKILPTRLAESSHIICIWDSPFKKNNIEECTSGTRGFLVGTNQNFILQGSLNF